MAGLTLNRCREVVLPLIKRSEMRIKSEKEQKYIKKMLEVERIKRKHSGLRRKQNSAARASKENLAQA